MELLAPAGNMESLHAAVQAGADAVYLGAGDFNARRGADNFTLDDLARACDYSHTRGVSVYMTVNTAVMPDEFDRALELVRQGYRRGVDAFIVQDLGLAREVRAVAADARLHISTQMNIHNTGGLAAAASLGASRVTLAREVSLPEMAHLCQQAKELGMDVEAFGHGALCICYSGQCYLSSLVGGRSANRGMCAQPCRLPYELHDSGQRKPLDAPGDRLLSPKDLCTAGLLGQLQDAGVASVKIEGRMKSPDYVASVVGVYRHVLDRLASDGHAQPTEAEQRRLSQSFNRGFTTAYLTQETNRSMMSYSRPNNRGAFVGRVQQARGDVVDVEAEAPLAAGDVLEFWTGRGHSSATVHEIEELKRRSKDAKGAERRQGRRGGKGNARKGAPKRVFRISGVRVRVGKGDRVFRLRTASQVFTDDPTLPKVKVSGHIDLRVGEPATLVLGVDGRGQASACGDVVEAARTKPLSASDVVRQVARMGTTPFELEHLDVRMDDGVGMGFSQLHHLRAQACERLQEQLLAPWHARRLHKQPKRAIVAARPEDAGCELSVLVSNPACARAARRAGADRVLVHAENYGRGQAAVAGQLSPTVEQMGYPKKAVIDMPVVDHDMVDGTREQTFGFDPWRYAKAGKPLVVSNIGQLFRAVDMGAVPEAGPHVIADNSHALQMLADMGARRAWLSPELSLDQVRQLGEESPLPLGLVVSGQAELMTTEHCMLTSQGPCAQNCGECPRRRSPHWLSDRKGYKIPVVTDLCGRSHLYNAVELDSVHLMPDIVSAGVTAVMVDATLMTVQQTTEATRRAKHARDLALFSGDAVGKRQGTTTGHLFRPVA